MNDSLLEILLWQEIRMFELQASTFRNKAKNAKASLKRSTARARVDTLERVCSRLRYILRVNYRERKPS